jgi:hypothetical protein
MHTPSLCAAASLLLLALSSAQAAPNDHQADARATAAQTQPTPVFAPYAMAASEFQDFRGEYHLDNGAILTLAQRGRRFYADLSGQPSVELVATSPNTFAAKDASLQLAFKQDANGLAYQVALTQPALHQGQQTLSKH